MFKSNKGTPENGGAECVCKEAAAKVKKQISKLYASSVLGNLSLSGAWVAILAARGFTLTEIGAAETVLHIVSIIFELPSGVLADVFGRRKMLTVSAVMRFIASIVMIMSEGLFSVCLSLAFQALAYNFSSGTGDALAYDSMKLCGREGEFERYNANQLLIYRLCSGISTLCAGFALFIGHKIAYASDAAMCIVQLALIGSMFEIYGGENSSGRRGVRESVLALAKCFGESMAFLKSAKKAAGLMLCNSLVGAADILLLFFLQAKLIERGIPVQALGAALLFMEIGGIAGSRLILKLRKMSYKGVFVLSGALILAGIISEHSPLWQIMTLGGFIAAMADDALQVRTNALLQDMFPSESRATLTSVDSLLFSVIMIFLTLPAGAFFSVW